MDRGCLMGCLTGLVGPFLCLLLSGGISELESSEGVKTCRTLPFARNPSSSLLAASFAAASASLAVPPLCAPVAPCRDPVRALRDPDAPALPAPNRLRKQLRLSRSAALRNEDAACGMLSRMRHLRSGRSPPLQGLRGARSCTPPSFAARCACRGASSSGSGRDRPSCRTACRSG